MNNEFSEWNLFLISGFIDIAGRCRDLSTIVFMDSVDERINGTIGGFCKNTVIDEEQCDIAHSYCNEVSVTCQCKPGYELKLDTNKQDDRVSHFVSSWGQIDERNNPKFSSNVDMF